MLGKHNGGASFSLFFPDTEQLSRRNERFLRLKKSVGETPKSDEQRNIASNTSHFPSTDRVYPSFDSHHPHRSEAASVIIIIWGAQVEGRQRRWAGGATAANWQFLPFG